MARHAQGPWYRKQTDSWYATMGGKNVPLGVKGKGCRSDAVAEWHRRMSSPGIFAAPVPKPEPAVIHCITDQPAPSDALTVAALIEHFNADAVKPQAVHGETVRR